MDGNLYRKTMILTAALAETQETDTVIRRIVHTLFSCSCSLSLSKNDRFTFRLFDDGGNGSAERGGTAAVLVGRNTGFANPVWLSRNRRRGFVSKFVSSVVAAGAADDDSGLINGLWEPESRPGIPCGTRMFWLVERGSRNPKLPAPFWSSTEELAEKSELVLHVVDVGLVLFSLVASEPRRLDPTSSSYAAVASELKPFFSIQLLSSAEVRRNHKGSDCKIRTPDDEVVSMDGCCFEEP